MIGLPSSVPPIVPARSSDNSGIVVKSDIGIRIPWLGGVGRFHTMVDQHDVVLTGSQITVLWQGVVYSHVSDVRKQSLGIQSLASGRADSGLATSGGFVLARRNNGAGSTLPLGGSPYHDERS